jgi:predicted membrane protein
MISVYLFLFFVLIFVLFFIIIYLFSNVILLKKEKEKKKKKKKKKKCNLYMNHISYEITSITDYITLISFNANSLLWEGENPKCI